MLPPTQVKRLNNATNKIRRDMRTTVMDAVLTRWKRSPNYRTPAVEAFVRDIEPIVRGAQKATTRVTNAYLETATGETGAGLIDPSMLRDGLEFTTEYQRPAITLYTASSEGHPYNKALRLATHRLLDLVATDLQLAYTRQAQHTLSGTKVKGYRRTIGSNKACALCLIASTRIYYKKELLPIHPGCQCGVEPFKGEVDMFGVIDQGTLDAVHAAVKDRFGHTDWGARDLNLGKTNAKGNQISDYTDLVLIREHGEYGPTLTWADNNFTGPKDLKYAGEPGVFKDVLAALH